jgi:hypothetical protein
MRLKGKVVPVYVIEVQGGSNMTGTDLCVNKSQFVPVIFEPPCIWRRRFIGSVVLNLRHRGEGQLHDSTALPHGKALQYAMNTWLGVVQTV